MGTSDTYDVVVLGGGAAGMMCAIEAGKRGRSVILLERNQNIGEKIRISGGGRCNFTNTDIDHQSYISLNPHFCKSALARYTPSDFIALVAKHGIRYHEKKLGQLFCDGSSRQIIEMLLTECRECGVEIQTSSRVGDIVRDDAYIVATDRRTIRCESLVVATGGLSIPKLGASDLGYTIARTFGIAITGMKPGLVPFTFSGDELRFFSVLSGVSIDALVSCSGMEFRENILFTHRGLSGPAILQVSSYWDANRTIVIDLFPGVDLLEEFKKRARENIRIPTFLSSYVPHRFAEAWCKTHGYTKPLNQMPMRELVELARVLHAWEVKPAGTEGYDKAEVTCGGVDTAELSSQTMETKKSPRLYFIGEVVDVTGWLGGYNFQWAWASGFAAGQYA